MNVVSHRQPSFYNNQSFKKIRSPQKKVISFGHYLDDELNEKITRSSGISSRIDEVEAKIEEKKRTNSSEIAQLNSIANQLRSDNSELSAQISKLTEIEAGKKETISTLKKEGQSTEQEIKSSKHVVEKQQREKEQVLEGIKQDSIVAEKARQEKSHSLIDGNNKLFQDDVNKALSGTKNTLITNVINNTVSESEGDKVHVPAGILFESESDDVSKKVFEWIRKKTDSHYAMVDADEFPNKFGLLNIITHIGEKSKKEFETTHTRSFTFIDNFDRIDSPDTPAVENDSIANRLKSFLEKCSEYYHNTIVVSTKKTSTPKTADFPIEIKLDGDFLQDSRLGYKSILSELDNLKSTGKNLLLLSFEAMSKVIK